jgi:hypothetical protein
MNGLYQRALQIYRQKNNLRLVSKGEEEGGMEEIPAEERENILREIDNILAKTHIGIEPRSLRGGKSGLALPFIVNVAILAAVAATAFLFTKNLNGEERQLASGARAIQSAESQVVEALRQESDAQIGQKDQEIVAFQKKLSEATAESERLQSETAAAIRKREQELSAEMAASLAAERQRLQGSGMKAESMDEQLRLYEDRLKAETAKQAEAFQKKAAEEAAKSQAAVNGMIAEYQQNLSQVQGERSRLQQQYQSRESELKSQYARDTKALQSEKSQAVADLNRIQELQRQESLVMGRILSSYDEVNQELRSGENESALKSLQALKDSLDREPARSLASVQSRRPVELFIIGSLEELIRNRVERDRGDVAALIDTKLRITSLREKAAQADRKFLEKDYPAARGLYLSALAELPEAKGSYDRLDAMTTAERVEKMEASRRARQKLIDQGSSFFQSQSWQATLDRYQQALALLLEDEATAASLVSQVAEAGYRLGAEKDAEREAARRAILPNRIALMRQELQGQAAVAGESTEPDFASLLQAKLLLWQIIGTDPIKSKYPELYDTMQRYFDTFASQQRQEGREGALRDVLVLTESLRKGESLPQAVPASDRDSMLRLLDGLESLLRE